MHRTHCPLFSIDILVQRIHNAPPLHAIGSATIAHVFIFFLHRAQLFTCASIAVYSFCTTHAPSTQSFHIKRAIINIASLPTGAIIAHRPNLRIPIMHTMAARQCLSIAFGEMSAFSNPKNVLTAVMRADSLQQRLCCIAVVEHVLLKLSRQRCISIKIQPAQRNQHQPAKRNNNKTHTSRFVRRVMADGSRCSWLSSKYSLFATSAMHQQPRPNPAYRCSLLIEQKQAGSVRSRLFESESTTTLGNSTHSSSGNVSMRLSCKYSLRNGV